MQPKEWASALGDWKSHFDQCPAQRGCREQWGWLFCCSTNALEPPQRFFTAFRLAGGLGCGAEPASLPHDGQRSKDQEAHCDARANAYFGKELVLKQAKLLDFTAAIRPA